MSAADLLPGYLDVSRTERGSSLGIDSETYRLLAATSLGVIEGTGSFMAVFALRDGSGCGLDIFGADRFLAIEIDHLGVKLHLFASDLDAAETPCILSIANSPDGWRELGVIARTEITKP
jgi:hypothetical protein